MRCRFVLTLALFGANLAAHETVTTKLTWSREISRIFAARCVSCHKTGGQAPMPLTTYTEARPWAVAIKEQVRERLMPPWGAVKGFGDFANDVSLSQEEMQRIAEWVEGGAPEGDPRLLPVYPPDLPKPVAAPRGKGTTVRDGAVLKRAIRLRAIRPTSLAGASSVQVTAQRPDGSIEPLLWLRRYDENAHRVFVYRRAIELPAGTRVMIDHPAATVAFLP